MNLQRRLAQISALKRLKELEKKQQLMDVADRLREKEHSHGAIKKQEAEIDSVNQISRELLSAGNSLDPVLLENRTHYISELYGTLQTLEAESTRVAEFYRESIERLAAVHAHHKLYSNTEAELEQLLARKSDQKEKHDLIRERTKKDKHGRSIHD